MHTTTLPPTMRRLVIASAAAASALLSACFSNDSPDAPTVRTLSSAPDQVSGGEVLVELRLPANAGDVRADVDGQDVSASFQRVPGTDTLLGRLSGLSVGAHTLSASAGGAQVRLALTNYPVTGPMFSGPHATPFNCQTAAFTLPDGSKLGAPLDANCSAATRVHYLYRSTAGGALKPLADPGTLPTDVASTTTTAGTVVPFVVRVETGTMNRGIYQNAVLHNPLTDGTPSPLNAPKGWNRKLIAVHGTGCTAGWYIQGAAMGVSPYTGTNLTRLGEGYAVFTNTLNHPTNSCNAVLAAETTLMGKAHFIASFGVPTATVSVGTSGGAYTSLQVADLLPGIFDGVFIDATFPDALSISLAALDSKLLNHVLTTPGLNTVGLSEAQLVKVSGHKSARAWYDLALQSGRTDPVSGRSETIPVGGFATAYASAVFNAAVPATQRYDAATNPAGARATVWDWGRNVYGVDSTGRGLRAFDNVGVQYGLAQLADGTLSPAQFVALNEAMGGYDSEGNYSAARSAGDANAIQRAHQGGLSLGGNGGLAAIPVFDASNFYDEDNFYHYQWFHFAVRERLRQANGHADNHVMWRGGVTFSDLFAPATANPGRTAINAKVATEGWSTFMQWVDAVQADTGSASRAQKVVSRKPAQAVDGCFSVATSPVFQAETQTRASSGAAGSCNALWPSWSFPRLQAGGPLAANVLKCQLKPVAAGDYPVSFTADELARLKAVFPAGVCDFSRSGTGQTALVPNASFGPSPLNLVFDITKR